MTRRLRARALAAAWMALLALCLPASSAPLRAAQKAQQEQPDAQPAQPPAATPYEPELLRLSEIIGALAYLRTLCGADDGDAWRAKMSALLAAEGDSQTRREQLAGAYNKGFRDYELIYRSCTPNAHEVISRYLAEGAQLTRDVTARFGGG